jgi:protein arginine kinase activator
MKCDICKEEEATIHIQEVVNNNIKSMHICEKCAKNYGFNNELIDIGYHLMGFLNKSDKFDFKNSKIVNAKLIKDNHAEENTIKCSHCHTTYDEFLDKGKLGCSFCYIAFQTQIKPIIRRIHGKVKHKGSVPEKYKKQIQLMEKVKQLNRKLKTAIKNEEFEKAAQFRDQINQSQVEMEKSL